jgi:hypothetical protein
MLRITIELLPGGNASRARTLGLMEVANSGGTAELGDYVAVLKKTPPFQGALKSAWRRGVFEGGRDDAEVLAGRVVGHHRTQRGVYDLMLRALLACGLGARLPAPESRQRGAPGQSPGDMGIGCVLTYEITGSRCGDRERVGADSCGTFARLFRGDPDAAQSRARDFVSELERRGYRLGAVHIVPRRREPAGVVAYRRDARG